MNGQEQIPDEELQAPPQLRKALAEMQDERVFVPPSIDAAILKQAREQLQKTPSANRMVWPAWIGLAACVSLIVWLVHNSNQPTASPAMAAGAVREDVNGDGQVDILDALALARQLEQGGKPDKQLDLNGDGVVDQRDAETLARHAVKLTKGGRS